MRVAEQPLVLGNSSYSTFSLVLIYRKDVETKSRPCLKTISAVPNAVAHGHRPLASLEIQLEARMQYVYVSFLATVEIAHSTWKQLCNF